MKKTIATILLLFFCITLMAQEEVTFNFSRKKLFFGSGVKIPIYVNGLEAGKLGNDQTLVYKAKLDISQPVTIVAKLRGTKIGKDLIITLAKGNSCNIEIGFIARDLYIQLLSGGVVKGGTDFVEDLTNLTPDQRSEALRQQWISKGGRLINESFLGSVTLISLSKPDFTLSGGGGQFTYSASMLNFKVPELKKGSQTWSSFVYGTSVNIQFYGATMSMTGMKPIGMFTYNPSISLNGGYTFGFGKFVDETKWKGVAFELTYRPSLMMSMTTIEGVDKSETTFNLNMMGFGFDINFNSFTANAAKLAPKSQSKFSFFVLPPVKDMPLIISIGYGRTFYRKPY
jgi:hypothetical protein